MKTEIRISGQIGGNFKLRSALSCYPTAECVNGMFNSFIITYPTKRDALQAIREGYKWLKQTDDELPHHFSKGKEFINYDASKAHII